MESGRLPESSLGDLHLPAAHLVLSLPSPGLFPQTKALIAPRTAGKDCERHNRLPSLGSPRADGRGSHRFLGVPLYPIWTPWMACAFGSAAREPSLRQALSHDPEQKSAPAPSHRAPTQEPPGTDSLLGPGSLSPPTCPHLDSRRTPALPCSFHQSPCLSEPQMWRSRQPKCPLPKMGSFPRLLLGVDICGEAGLCSGVPGPSGFPWLLSGLPRQVCAGALSRSEPFPLGPRSQDLSKGSSIFHWTPPP